jgi:phosphoribosylglycinamide formyltransferase-1
VKRVAVFASGRGSNLGALLEAQGEVNSYRVALVVSNIESSGALEVGRRANTEALLVPSRGVARQDHETAVIRAINDRSIDMVCLAGYMRILGPAFFDGFRKPILNVHPSLLPAFPGMDAQRQAIAAGVRWSGATVHFVDGGLDTGPIILQEPVRVEPSDTEASLSFRILETEHRLYPSAVDLVARGEYEIRGRIVHLIGNRGAETNLNGSGS